MIVATLTTMIVIVIIRFPLSIREGFHGLLQQPVVRPDSGGPQRFRPFWKDQHEKIMQV